MIINGKKTVKIVNIPKTTLIVFTFIFIENLPELIGVVQSC
jgi:hypothetical protein